MLIHSPRLDDLLLAPHLISSKVWAWDCLDEDLVPIVVGRFDVERVPGEARLNVRKLDYQKPPSGSIQLCICKLLGGPLQECSTG